MKEFFKTADFILDKLANFIVYMIFIMAMLALLRLVTRQIIGEYKMREYYYNKTL